jgi:hypothetical protein
MYDFMLVYYILSFVLNIIVIILYRIFSINVNPNVYKL